MLRGGELEVKTSQDKAPRMSMVCRDAIIFSMRLLDTPVSNHIMLIVQRSNNDQVAV